MGEQPLNLIPDWGRTRSTLFQIGSVVFIWYWTLKPNHDGASETSSISKGKYWLHYPTWLSDLIQAVSSMLVRYLLERSMHDWAGNEEWQFLITFHKDMCGSGCGINQDGATIRVMISSLLGSMRLEQIKLVLLKLLLIYCSLILWNFTLIMFLTTISRKGLNSRKLWFFWSRCYQSKLHLLLQYLHVFFLQIGKFLDYNPWILLFFFLIYLMILPKYQTSKILEFRIVWLMTNFCFC